MIENPFDKNGIYSCNAHYGWNMCLLAVVQWLNEPCNIHVAWGWEFIERLHFEDGLGNDKLPYWKHRYLCPKCMQELKSQVGE